MGGVNVSTLGQYYLRHTPALAIDLLPCLPFHGQGGAGDKRKDKLIRRHETLTILLLIHDRELCGLVINPG